MNNERERILIERKATCEFIAQETGWLIHDWQPNIQMISFIKDDCRINVYTSTMTVTTQLLHPKKGKTQLHRKGVNYQVLKEIFTNPRVHTNKGYYKKKS